MAVYHKRSLFNADGEWIGFVRGKDVYDPNGVYLGFFSDDRRLLRRRTPPERPRQIPPPRPIKPDFPPHMPLAPMLRSLPYHLIDMFEEYPERLIYISETRPDME